LPKEQILAAIKMAEFVQEKKQVEAEKVKERKVVEESNLVFLPANSIDAGLFIAKEKECNPVVLVFANESKPGASYKGGGGQEEDIFRRTCLSYSIDNDVIKTVAEKHIEYNIRDAGVIYAPDVLCFRKHITEGYKYCLPEKLSFILSSPVNRPKLDGNKMVDKAQIERMEKKIRTVLTVAFEKKHDAVVLGAFGCGHAKNSPSAVLKIINNIISTEFPHAFKYVVFAVIDDPETAQPEQKSNVESFKKFIEKSHDKHCILF